MTNTFSRATPSWWQAIACLVLLAPTVANSAAIFLHQPVSTGTFRTAGPETRATLIQVLNPVEITAIGVDIDPDGRSEFAWRIYNADSDTGASAVLPNPVDLGTAFFEETGIFFDDLGFQVYDHTVSVALGTGYYMLELFIKDPGTWMRSYSETAVTLPLITTDGNFRVINGLGHPSTPGLVQDLFGLPAFSVTTASVSEPNSALLLAAGVLAFRRQCRKTVNSESS